MPRRPAPAKSSGSTIARYLLDGPVLPLVTETLPIAEQARRALLASCKYLARRNDPGPSDTDMWRLAPALSGKDDEGRPRTGHQHAYFLPADEDGDGRIDRLTVFAPMGFNDLECQAINRLRHLAFDEGEQRLQLLLIGLGKERDFRAPLLDEATVWVSATPFVVTRYPKRRGTKRDQPADYASPQGFARYVLTQELIRRELPEVLSVDEVLIGAHKLRSIQFKRFRSRKRGDDGGRRPAGGFRITFAQPVRGPLCLGHSCHFGLGLFLPDA